jgi:KH domain
MQMCLTAKISFLDAVVINPGHCNPANLPSQSARVTIKISDRSKMDPDMNEREVSITGLYGAVKLAEAMIAEKLNQSRARMSNAREEEGDGHVGNDDHAQA